MIFTPANQRLIMLAVVATGFAVLIAVLLFQLGGGLAEAQEPPPNSPGTGAPIIIGMVQASETLTVDTSEISDGDGLVNATFGYQWISNDGTTDTDIAYATRSTYIIKPWDLGNYIKVRVNFTDNAGNEETLTSVATTAVEASPNKTPTGAPFLSGMAETGQALKVLVFGIRDANGMRHATLYYQYATFSYQWIRSDGTTDVDIQDANGSSYTLTDADEGKTIKVRVSFIDDGANSEALTSSATATVAARPSTSELSAPTALSVGWSQGEEKGLELNWTAPEGIVTGYQILRTEIPTRARWWEPYSHGCTPLTVMHVDDTGSDATTYTDTDVGESASYIYSVRALNSDGVGRKSSTSTQLQYRPHVYWPNGVPGSPRKAPTNLASTQIKNGIGLTWDAPEGEVTGYQILRRLPEQCEFGYRVYVENINSIDTHWADRDVVAGTRYEYHVRAINHVGAGRLDTRNSTSLRPATLVVGPEPNSPATGTPTFTGTAQVGETLIADPSGIADADGMYWARFSYQWLSSRGTEIEGATNSTYTLQASDANKVIRVRVTFTDDAGYEESVTSEATSAVVSNVPVTGAPIITGTVVVGETLTADTSGIDDLDGLDNVSFSYQWIRSDGTTDWDIEGATGTTYKVAAHLGQAIKVRVNFTDDSGNVESLTSPATAPVPIPEVTLTFSLEGTTVTCDYYNVHTVNRPYKECDDPSSTEQGESGEIEVELAIARSPSSQLYKFRFHIYQMEDSLGHDKGVEANDLCLGPGLADSVSIETTPDDGTGPFRFTDEGTIFELCPAGTYQLYVPWYMYNYDNQEYELAGTFRRYFFIDGNDEVDTSIEKVNFIPPLYPDPPASHGDVLITGTQESRVINRELTPFSLSIDGLVPDSDPETTDYVVSLQVIGNDADSLRMFGRYGHDVPWCHVGNVGYSYLLKTVPEDGGWAMEAHVLGGCISHWWPDRLQIELFNGSYEFIAGKDIALGALPNSAATGAPTISGTPTVGQTLTASASNITDTDGLDNAAYTYQWIRSDGATDTDISGATGTTYLVTTDDVGKTIRVKVSFTDDAENQESLTSEATETVGVSELHDRPYNLQATVAEGAITLTWQDPDTHSGHGLYHILRHRPELGEDKSYVYVEYTPSTDRTFTDSAVEPGVLYVYAVKAVKDYFGFLGPASNPVEVRMPLGEGGEAPNSPATGVPTISGTAQVGETLTVDTSGISDPDGLESATFTYNWFASDNSEIGLSLGAGIHPTYVVQSRSEGKNIEVTVAFTDDAGNPEGPRSEYTATVTAAANPRVPEAPTYRRVDPPLSVSPQGSGELEVTWSMPGYPYGDGGSAITSRKVQWKEASGSWDNDADVSEEVVLGHCWVCRYTITGLTNGVAYTVRVFVTNAIGDSPPSDELTSTPTDGTAFTLSGITRANYPEDERLPVAVYTVTGAQAAITWSLSGGDSEEFSISTGGDSRFKSLPSFENPTDADRDNQYRVTIQASDGTNTATLQVVVVVNSRGRPIINGNAQVGQTLTADTSGITDADGLYNPNFTYQWIANDGNTDSEIAGATASTYTLTDSEEGKTIKVRVSFTDYPGNEESLHSAATAAVAADPTDTGPLTGFTLWNASDQTELAQLADGGALSVDDPDSGSYGIRVEFEANAEIGSVRLELTGAKPVTKTESMAPYSLYGDDADGLNGEPLPVGEYALRATAYSERGGNGDELGSLEVSFTVTDGSPQPPPNSPATGLPTISGTGQVGETLTVDTNDIHDPDGTGDAVFTYQWLSEETEIVGATDDIYTLTDAGEGNRIRVRVSFTDDEGNPETLTSEATDTVAGRPPEPLTASLENTPTSHDGEAAFTFELRFSKEPDPDFSYKTLRDHAFTVTGGAVKKAQRLDKPSNILWRITVEPDSSADVAVILPVTTDCGDQGAICTEDGRELSNRNELTVSGPGG